MLITLMRVSEVVTSGDKIFNPQAIKKLIQFIATINFRSRHEALRAHAIKKTEGTFGIVNSKTSCAFLFSTSVIQVKSCPHKQ